MKKFLLIFLSTSLFFFINFHTQAFAHFEETNNDMTVTLHIEPNDNPIPTKQSNLYFLFDLSGEKFSVATCNCLVTISDNGQQIHQEFLTANTNATPSIWGSRMPFIFPKNATYHIALSGKPKNGDTFQPFAVSWDFRVDPPSSGIIEERPSDVPYILTGSIVILIFLILLGLFVKKEIM